MRKLIVRLLSLFSLLVVSMTALSVPGASCLTRMNSDMDSDVESCCIDEPCMSMTDCPCCATLRPHESLSASATGAVIKSPQTDVSTVPLKADIPDVRRLHCVACVEAKVQLCLHESRDRSVKLYLLNRSLLI